MIVKLLTEHHLEFISLKWGCTSSSESTLVKMPHCWKAHAMAHVIGKPTAPLHEVDTHNTENDMTARPLMK